MSPHGYFFNPSRCFFFSIGVHGEALDDANLQILPDRSHFVRIHILHVRMARPREGHFIGPRTTEVCPTCFARFTGDQVADSLLAAENHAYFRTYLIASVAGIYSLFPLLFTPAG